MDRKTQGLPRPSRSSLHIAVPWCQWLPPAAVAPSLQPCRARLRGGLPGACRGQSWPSTWSFPTANSPRALPRRIFDKPGVMGWRREGGGEAELHQLDNEARRKSHPARYRTLLSPTWSIQWSSSTPISMGRSLSSRAYRATSRPTSDHLPRHPSSHRRAFHPLPLQVPHLTRSGAHFRPRRRAWPPRRPHRERFPAFACVVGQIGHIRVIGLALGQLSAPARAACGTFCEYLNLYKFVNANKCSRAARASTL